MDRYNFINVFGVKIGDNLDNAIKILSGKGIDLKEVSNANKRIRQLGIAEKQAFFDGVLYNYIQLTFMDNILYSITLSKVTDVEEGILEYKEENKKISSAFGCYKLERETDVLKEYFFTDTFISCITRYSKIITLDKMTKGYLNIRYFDNISELSKDRTISNPSIVSIIRENLYMYKNANLSNNKDLASNKKINQHFLGYKGIKALIILLLGVFLFLFALNGRYEILDNKVVIDKWKKEAILMGSDELPFRSNGEIIKQHK